MTALAQQPKAARPRPDNFAYNNRTKFEWRDIPRDFWNDFVTSSRWFSPYIVAAALAVLYAAALFAVTEVVRAGDQVSANSIGMLIIVVSLLMMSMGWRGVIYVVLWFALMPIAADVLETSINDPQAGIAIAGQAALVWVFLSIFWDDILNILDPARRAEMQRRRALRKAMQNIRRELMAHFMMQNRRVRWRLRLSVIATRENYVVGVYHFGRFDLRLDPDALSRIFDVTVTCVDGISMSGKPMTDIHIPREPGDADRLFDEDSIIHLENL